MNEARVWCMNGTTIANMTEDYFKKLFTKTQRDSFHVVLDLVDRVVRDGMNKTLVLPCIVDEVCVALFQMHPSKSSNPNGMSPFLFWKYYHIIGDEVVGAVLSVLNSGHVLHKMNYTYIVTIPKKNNSHYMSDCHLINLGNLVSRIVSKVLANWVKTILPSTIFDSHSAFVLD